MLTNMSSTNAGVIMFNSTLEYNIQPIFNNVVKMNVVKYSIETILVHVVVNKC